MLGSIRCVRCNAGIDENGTGVCPKCNAVRGYWVDVYWPRRRGGDAKHRGFRPGLGWNETKARLWEARAAINEGRFSPAEFEGQVRNRFDVWYEKWIEELERSTLAPSTINTYRCTVGSLLPSLGSLDVGKIEYQDIKDALDDLPCRGSSKRTIRDNLHSFYQWLRRHKGKPIRVIPPFPRVNATGQRAKSILTSEQQAEALNRLPDQWRDVYTLMMLSGIRPSEVLLIKVSDINPARKCLTVSRTYSKNTVKDRPKDKQPRTLPLSSKAWEIALRNIGDRIGDVYLFPKTDGSAWSYSTLRTKWKQYSGYSHVCLKDAGRRSWATRMRNAGVNMDAIRQALGHSDTQVTKKYLDDDVEWAREQFDAADVIPLNGSETGLKGKS